MQLEFVTVTTGNTMRYERADMPDAVIDTVGTLLRAGGVLPRGWTVVVQRSTPEEAMYDLLLDGIMVTHCWLCLSQHVAEQIWHNATDASDLPLVEAHQQPATVPWLAVGMAIGVIDIVQTRPERLMEAAEVELCVAWALAEHPLAMTS
jgi:hypothetical protein